MGRAELRCYHVQQRRERATKSVQSDGHIMIIADPKDVITWCSAILWEAGMRPAKGFVPRSLEACAESPLDSILIRIQAGEVRLRHIEDLFDWHSNTRQAARISKSTTRPGMV